MEFDGELWGLCVHDLFPGTPSGHSMSQNSVGPEPKIPREAIEELAASGAICQECGGLHQVSLDQLIHWLSVEDRVKVSIPWCRCESCPVCGPFLSRIAPAIAAHQRGGDPE